MSISARSGCVHVAMSASATALTDTEVQAEDAEKERAPDGVAAVYTYIIGLAITPTF